MISFLDAVRHGGTILTVHSCKSGWSICGISPTKGTLSPLSDTLAADLLLIQDLLGLATSSESIGFAAVQAAVNQWVRSSAPAL